MPVDLRPTGIRKNGTSETEHWGQNIGDVEDLFHDFVEKCRITDFIVYNSVCKILINKRKERIKNG